MKNPFQTGDIKIFETTVTDEKLARFEAGLVHPVYSTFSLAKDAEWACRLFVLAMLDEGEEGIGAFVSVEHISPALLGADVEIIARLDKVDGNRIDCTYEAFCGERLLARGKQSQRIINKAKFDAFLSGLES